LGHDDFHDAQRAEPEPRLSALAANGVVERHQAQAQQIPTHPDHSTLLNTTAATTATAAMGVLSRGRTASHVYELATNAFELAQKSIKQVLARTSPQAWPACRAGCAFCCAIPVAVSAPEALYIAAYLQATLSAAAQVDLRTDLQARVEQRHGWAVDARHAHKRHCVFLSAERQCGIYAIRPLACRGYNSMSRAACEENFAGYEDRVQMHVGVREAAAGTIYGLIMASKRLGLEWGRYELEAAVLRALDTPDAAERWARGEQVFTACDQIAMPSHVAQKITALKRFSGTQDATS
jgi:Fe-S-cluster containining protein